MLVLSRQRDQSVIIGPIIANTDLRREISEALMQAVTARPESILAKQLPTVLEILASKMEHQIVDIRGDKVRSGYEVHKAIDVHRKEVYESIRRENRAAAAANLQPGELAPSDGDDGYVPRK